MANANHQDKHRLKSMAAAEFSEQSVCPIPEGELGLWNDGGDLTFRQADGNDTVLLDLSQLDYAEDGDMAAAGNADANDAGTSDEVSRADHVHAQGKIIATATALQITDPGDAGAVAVTHSGVCNMTSGASGETRTVDDPTFVGQTLDLCLDTDGGGDVAVTFASDFNQAGNNIITFGDAGDHASFVAVTIGGTRAWRLVVNDGAALSG